MKRPVGLRCTICNHPARPQIDLAIATGLSKRAVAERFGVSRDAVWRHAQAHLTAEMRAALATKLLQREGDTRRILLEEGAGVTEALKAIRVEPDPWQASLLRSRAPWILLNCCRQSGKSTTTAAVALHTAIYDPGLILLVSPSLRQSKELFAKVTGFLKDLEPAEVLEEDNKSCCSLANGARVVSLPGDPDTLRGYSASKLIIKDEAAFVSDAMQAALDPMLAVSKGRLIEMSSPNGKRGHFCENWEHGVGVERIKIIGRECPRIGVEFLEKMRMARQSG